MTEPSDSADPPRVLNDRRNGARHVPSQVDAKLGWWSRAVRTLDFAPTWVDQYALLLDIGSGGASTLTDRIPEPGRSVWIRNGGGDASSWVEARVVETVRSSRGPHVVRLYFVGRRADDFLMASVGGRNEAV